jgi:hypothetical protein
MYEIRHEKMHAGQTSAHCASLKTKKHKSRKVVDFLYKKRKYEAVNISVEC